MSMLNKINIIGNETHGSRYRDAALFYPTVEVLNYNDSCFSEYDTIILAEPYLWNEDFMESLETVGFCGALILEKMPFDSLEALVRFNKREYQFRIYHAMLRLFEDKVLNPEIKSLTIRWPNLFKSQMSKSRHTLPNVLLFCYAQLGMDAYSVRNLSCEENSLNVTLVSEKYHVDLEIYDTDDTAACVQVNEKMLQWPNYIQLIHRLFDTIRKNGEDWRVSETIICDIIKIVEKIKN